MHRLSIPFGIKTVGERQLEGHGSIFGNVDLGADIVLPGAFKRSLAEHAASKTMPAMLWQHQTDQIPGVWLEAAEDDSGLLLKGEFADTQLGREAKVLAKMRAFRGLSIGGMIEEFDFDKAGNRLIKGFELWEVSLVTFPMNPKATIEAVKSQFSTPRSLEQHLREVGVSQKAAKELVHDLLNPNGMLDDSGQWDVDDDEVLEAVKLVHDQLMAGMFRSQLNH